MQSPHIFRRRSPLRKDFSVSAQKGQWVFTMYSTKMDYQPITTGKHLLFYSFNYYLFYTLAISKWQIPVYKMYSFVLLFQVDYMLLVSFSKFCLWHFVQMAPVTLCANCCDIWTEYVGIGMRSGFLENSKWRIVCLDANGCGLYGKMCHEPRIPGKKIS